MNAQRLTILTAAILVVAGIGFVIYQRSQPSTVASTSFDGSLDLSNQPFIGAEDASVVVAIFEDFKCPACRSFEENVYPQLERDYIRTDKIKLHFVNFAIPLGPDSITAAIAGECAFEQSPGVFWEYKTILYRSQGPENQRWATPTALVDLAKTYVPDINTDELKTCIEEERYKDRVQEERDMGVAAGVEGTPTMYINGEKVANAFDYNNVKALIDAQLNN